MDEQVRVRAVVTGRVQGVFFRQTCRERAGALTLSGWARNLDDGSVEIVVQGSRSAVDELLAWAASGPPLARVSGVQTEVLPLLSDESSFRIG